MVLFHQFPAESFSDTSTPQFLVVYFTAGLNVWKVPDPPSPFPDVTKLPTAMLSLISTFGQTTKPDNLIYPFC
jgi:hypothetical protein